MRGRYAIPAAFCAATAGVAFGVGNHGWALFFALSALIGAANGVADAIRKCPN